VATARMVRDNVNGFSGPGTLYEIDPPMKGADHLLLFYRPEFMGQEGQLNVILATKNGASFTRDVRPQLGTHVTREPNHALALALAGGYTIVAPDSEPETVEAATLPPQEQFDPSQHTVAEVNAYLEDADPDEKARVLEQERAGKARKGILGGN
jgi:hypothetical protein